MKCNPDQLRLITFTRYQTFVIIQYSLIKITHYHRSLPSLIISQSLLVIYQ
jgi:hypothetical protein